jgi:hypothetical protein
MEALELRILGPLEVSREGNALPFARGKERALLALLLVNRNEVVPVDDGRRGAELGGGRALARPGGTPAVAPPFTNDPLDANPATIYFK